MQELKTAVEALQKNLTDTLTDLEPRIKELEAKELGSAEVKETVAKMSEDNAKFVDQIKAITEAMKQAEEDEKAFKEDIQKRLAQRASANSAAFKSAGLHVAEAIAKDINPFQKLKRAAGQSHVIEFKHFGLSQKHRQIVPQMMLDKDGDILEQIKMITNADASAGDTIDYMRVPGIFGPGQRNLIVRDLFPIGTTTSDTVRYVVEATVTDNAQSQADQGDTKGESDFTFNATDAPVVTIAHFVVVSTQVLDDAAMMQSYLDGRMRYLLLLEEESQILNGDGTSGSLNGVITQASAYNPGLATQLGVSAVQDVDILRVAMLQVVQAEYPPTAHVLNPFNWAAIELLKDTQERYLLAAPQNSTQPRLWGLPVAVSLSMPQGEFLTGSFALGGQIWDRMSAAVPSQLKTVPTSVRTLPHCVLNSAKR